MRGLAGKTTLITGGASGIGEAISLRLTEEAAQIAIFDRNADAAGQIASSLESAGCRSHIQVVDIADAAAVERAVATVEDQLGPIDCLVNNAGWDRMTRFIETDEAFRDLVMAINLKGPINVTHSVVRRMAARRSGRVVSISSDAGRVGSSGQAVYSACKGGIIALMKTLARELARDNILLNTVCPGPTQTPMMTAALANDGAETEKILTQMAKGIPLRRIGQPQDLAGIVAFLLSEEASYITGQVISVSGGLTMHG
jgi:2-hydroxycyclohexanecarboxyl-CoA dehydrogenase